jgi:type III secretion protein R
MTSGLGNAALLAAIAVIPIVVLMMTSFVKISVVLSLLRNAIGAPEAPSGLIVMGLSLLLTFFVMAPVAIDMVHAAAEVPPSPGKPSGVPAGSSGVPAGSSGVPAGSSGAPAGSSGVPAGPSGVPAGSSSSAPRKPVDLDVAIRELLPPQYRPQIEAATRGLGPLRTFLARHASARDRETFTALAGRMGRAVQGDELWVLAPAFVTTELREAFAIAVLIFVPFLVIDLVVGLGLAALGLTSTSPQTVALPLKLLLFVSIDGWRLLVDGLLRGYV